jgi:hypothetical protein
MYDNRFAPTLTGYRLLVSARDRVSERGGFYVRGGAR